MPPHNLPLTVMGAGLLWFGWFGFNAGSALGANGLAGHAFITTNTAAAAAVAGLDVHGVGVARQAHRARARPRARWPGSWRSPRRPASSRPLASIVIGAVAGVICYSACNLKTKLGYDDSLDVVGVHGVGGTWGALATGIFATKAVNEAGADGLLYGNPKQLLYPGASRWW